MAKHVPICVCVPGSNIGAGPETLDLTPSEAVVLKERLEREIDRWNKMLEKTGGVSQARMAMGKYYRSKGRY